MFRSERSRKKRPLNDSRDRVGACAGSDRNNREVVVFTSVTREGDMTYVAAARHR